MGRNKINNTGSPLNPNAQSRQFWQSARKNKGSWLQYYNRLVELSVSMFEWKNLPDTVDPRFLELVLFSQGMAVFFKDKDLNLKLDIDGNNVVPLPIAGEQSKAENEGSYLALRTMIGGHLNVYEIPTIRQAYASNGYHMPLDETNSVIIFNNLIHTDSQLDVRIFAERLYNLDRAIDVNANAQKTPILIQASETERLTMKQLYMKYEGNEPFIFGDKGLNVDGLKVLKTDAPFVADKLYKLKNDIWNEALTYLGISNVNTQKKERMVTSEVTQSQGGTIASRYSRLEARRQACKQINEMFNLDVWCDFREDFQVVGQADDVKGEPNSDGITEQGTSTGGSKDE